MALRAAAAAAAAAGFVAVSEAAASPASVLPLSSPVLMANRPLSSRVTIQKGPPLSLLEHAGEPSQGLLASLSLHWDRTGVMFRRAWLRVLACARGGGSVARIGASYRMCQSRIPTAARPVNARRHPRAAVRGLKN